MTAEEQLQQIAKLIHTNEGETLAHAIARMIDRGVHDDKRRREALDGARDAKMALEAALFRERVLECQYNDLRAKSGLPPHRYVLPLCVNRWQCATCLERATCTTLHLNNRARWLSTREHNAELSLRVGRLIAECDEAKRVAKEARLLADGALAACNKAEADRDALMAENAKLRAMVQP